MSTRAREDRQWEAHRDQIIRLYQTDDLPLQQIMVSMELEKGFLRTKSQYERRLKMWRVRKYSKADEWKFLARRLNERDSQRLRTCVEIRGKRIPEEKLRKEVARQGYLTTIERFDTELQSRHRSVTPTGIQIFTPRSMSPLVAEASTTNTSSSMSRSHLSVKLTDDLLLSAADCTPWRQFTRFVRNLSSVDRDYLLLPWQSKGWNSNTVQNTASPIAHTSHGLELVQQTERSRLQTLLDNILSAMYTTDESGLLFSAAWINPTPFIPPNHEGTPDIDVNAVISLDSRSTQLEFLKLAVHIISNNFDVIHRVSSTIVELLFDKHNRMVLLSLLDTGLLIDDALFEKLLVPAVDLSNIHLLEIIVQRGYDLNVKSFMNGFYANAYFHHDVTILEYAIQCSDERTVTFLLDHGANGNQSPVSLGSPFYALYHLDSLLDLALELGKPDIARTLLSPRPQFKYGIPKVNPNMLRIVILQGNHGMFQLLVAHEPKVKDQILEEPWILLEAAAFQGDPLIFPVLFCYGLDIKKTDHMGQGSALAAASGANNLSLVSYLLDMGAQVDGVALGYKHNRLDTSRDRPSNNYQFENIRGKSALHLAIESRNAEMITLLFSKGADVNQCCQDVFPIQIAVEIGDQSLLNMLLSAGADVNAVAGTIVAQPWAASPWRSDYRGFMLHGVPYANLVGCPWQSGRVVVHDDNLYTNLIGRPSIRIALEEGNADAFYLLLRYGAIMPTNCTDDIWWNPVRSAIFGRNAHLLTDLLTGVFQESWVSEMPAHEILAECMFYGGSSMGREMIKLGLIQMNDAFSPEVLCAAVFHHDTVLVNRLLEGSRGSSKTSCGGAAGFVVAILRGHLDMVKMFLRAGVRPYEIVPELRQPAAKLYRLDRVRTALAATTHPWCTPLNLASEEFGLLAHGCSKPDADDDQQEIWQVEMYRACLGAIKKRSLPFLIKLLSKGINADWAEPELPTLLQYALKWEALDIAAYLLDSNADPNGNDLSRADPRAGLRLNSHADPPTTNTPLQYASQYGDSGLVECLLRRGAGVHARPCIYRGATALQFAAMAGNFQNVNLLLKAGADLNAPPGIHEGRTAIEGAAEAGRLNMVSYLLEAGADIRGKTNPNYRRTIHRAWKNGHRALVQLIQSWKTKRYGREDCEDVSTILKTMTEFELRYESHEAFLEFEQWVGDDDDKRRWLGALGYQEPNEKE